MNDESLARLKQDEPDLYSHVDDAIDIINGILHANDASNIALAFNGGKDCTVLLALLIYLQSGKHTSKTTVNACLGGITVLMFHIKPQFSEVSKFVEAVTRRYKLTIREIEADSMKSALFQVTSTSTISTFITGTRASDSEQNLSPVMDSDEGWPELVRVHPLIHWTAADVWKFIHYFSVPYCDLYSQGYTSLGNLSDCKPNPLLRRPDGSFAPAWQLLDSTQERVGRT